jgi:hypothetical protein
VWAAQLYWPAYHTDTWTSDRKIPTATAASAEEAHLPARVVETTFLAIIPPTKCPIEDEQLPCWRNPYLATLGTFEGLHGISNPQGVSRRSFIDKLTSAGRAQPP